jgi:hypothetical protein
MSFGLCNATASFQRCMMSIFSNMIEEIMEVFIDDFSVYGKTFDSCFENVDKVFKDVKCNTASVSLHVNHDNCINISIIMLIHKHTS